MSVAKNDIHPAISLSAHLLATITYATSVLEARRSEARTQDLIFKLQLEETISKIDADNLRVLFRGALEKRLWKISSE
jgi:hypothetical protein